MIEKESNLLKNIYNSGVFGMYGSFRLGSGEYLNPDNIGIETYEKMLTDETCRSGFEYMSLVATANIGEYSHPDLRINDFINRQFEGMRGSLVNLVEELLSALWAGFSVGEMVLLPGDGGSVNLSEIQFLDPEMVTFSLFEDGEEKNHIKNVRQGYGIGTGTEIPREKLLIYSHGSRFGNPYGNSRFQSCYNSWFAKMKKWADWALCLEKYAVPTPDITVEDPNGTVTDEHGRKITNIEQAYNIVDTISKGRPVAHSKAVTVEFMQIQRAMGADFLDFMNYHNKMIYRAMLLPSLMESGEKGGSYALGDVHYKMFQFAIDKIRNDVTEVLLDQLVKPLIIWNFGKQDEYGLFAYNNVDPSTAKIFSEIFASMTTSGYISPSQKSDMDLVREKLGIPGVSDEEWQRGQDEQEERARRLQDAQRELQQTKEPPKKVEDTDKTDGGNGEGQPGEDLQASMVGLEDADDKQRTLEADMDPGSIFRRNMDKVYYLNKRAQA